MASPKNKIGIFTGIALIGILVTMSMTSHELIDLEALSTPVGFDNILVTNITENSAVVMGTTKVKVNCEVEYGTDETYSRTATDSDMMSMGHTEHKVTLLELDPSTKYDYRFKASLQGDDYYSKKKSFMTSPLPVEYSSMEQ